MSGLNSPVFNSYHSVDVAWRLNHLDTQPMEVSNPPSSPLDIASVEACLESLDDSQMAGNGHRTLQDISNTLASRENGLPHVSEFSTEPSLQPSSYTPLRSESSQSMDSVYEVGVSVAMYERTAKAIGLFYKYQGRIDSATINRAKDDFIDYLQASTRFNTEQKRLARHALLETECIEGECFGPLINETGFFVYNSRCWIRGVELIGRVWIFASGLNGSEEINAKDSMISALISSYCDDQEKLYRSSNAIKTLHLIVAVLQGRLAGVNIDGLDILEPIATDKAMQKFFSKLDHRSPDITLDALIQAAHGFCDQFFGVNREDFIHAMKEYAETQGIN